MFNPWLELDGVEDRLGRWSELAGLDLIKLGTTAEADEIKDTSVTQPLVVALSLIAAEEMRRRFEVPADTPVAGHSVGELAAAAIAGVLSADDAVALAAVRGREMAAACALEPTGMSAVLGGDEQTVLETLERLGLDAANRNGAGQIVAAGKTGSLEVLAAEPPEGARVRPLPVAGAFHTRFMVSAQETLAKHAEDVDAGDAVLPLLSNADGAVVSSADDVLSRLVNQVTNPVRWDSCMSALGERGVDAVVEFPPAGALTGMVRRALKGVQTIALKTPADLDKVADQLGSAA
ncbi:[acyl-carrier-protein] S-malonyltransferase [Saccharopolyspora dendranthemae]|uniref:[acyl-carrier-protein] S-malonyltransferase n=2 Tax=Saccharopolyspora dendranthemae TaxID=1181886 RepID=A0A561TX71_9PSEU|nr:[acyl-carrier-protein] S-malonyltransferase [Saccharopolyspora dendranthemae]